MEYLLYATTAVQGIGKVGCSRGYGIHLRDGVKSAAAGAGILAKLCRILLITEHQAKKGNYFERNPTRVKPATGAVHSFFSRMNADITRRMAKPQIDFQHLGIATVLKHQRLMVPANQRDYLWEAQHVRELFQDLAGAISSSKSSYFLGTVVFTSGNEVPDVTDGQQRLATVSILLAAIRDYYAERKKDTLVTAMENEFLFTIDRDTERRVPKLTLNLDDRDFFDKRILSRPTDPVRKTESPRPSHILIANAAQLAAKHVKSITTLHGDKAALAELERWTKYLEQDATVIQITVPDEVNAFKMFETLNDRGLKVSQAYLVKNFLFGEAGASATAEVHPKWAQMSGALETLADDDAVMNYLWNIAILLSGHTRAPEIFDRIKEEVKGSAQAVDFVKELAERSADYIAIMQADHVKWKGYPSSIRKLIETINVLRVKVHRPAMFAVSTKFSPAEAAKAFKLILSWSVRFLIVGGGRSGSIQESYAAIASEIHSGKIKTAKELSAFGQKFVPTDTEFLEAFSTAKVSAAHLARYYLRALENKALNQSEPEFIVNDDVTEITLEHIFPQKPEDKWPTISPDIADVIVNRLGNLALLKSSQNSGFGNTPFLKKVTTYKSSGFKWTKSLEKFREWGAKEITERQNEMAKNAVKIWPLKV